MTDPFVLMDATEQAALVARGDASPSELVEAAIARIEAINPQLNAVIHPRFDAARAEAANAPEGPLRGVPFVVKDLDGTLAGEPFHMGNRALRDAGHRAERDSHLIARLRAAGAIPVGKTNTPELGLQPTTEPVAYGPTRNPWDTGHGPGGSSGGTGAAVASGMVPFGHAGDGGGSIRIPASANGLFGLKPSRGRVSLGPDEGEAWNGFVMRGVLTRSVRDTALALDVIAGAMPGDPYTAPPPRRPYVQEVDADPGALRIGIITTAPSNMCETDPECVAAAEDMGRLLESLGHTVEPAAPAALDEDLLGMFMTVLATNVVLDLADISAAIGREVTADDVEPLTWTYAELGRVFTGPQLQEALRAINAWRRRVQAWWEVDGYDLLLTPTMAEPPPALGHLSAEAEDPAVGAARATPYVAYCAAWNVTGQPAASIPTYWSAAGLPIGVQLVAGPWREDVLLQVAGQVELARPWAERRPPVHA